MKIQHKRSNVLDNGAAKEPTAGQMEYGELAVNYNAADPSLFIKDSADQIRKIGGDLDLYALKTEAGANVIIALIPQRLIPMGIRCVTVNCGGTLSDEAEAAVASISGRCEWVDTSLPAAGGGSDVRKALQKSC